MNKEGNITIILYMTIAFQEALPSSVLVYTMYGFYRLWREQKTPLSMKEENMSGRYFDYEVRSSLLVS